MKHILIILLTLWSGNSFLGMENNSFDTLWAEVEAFEKKRLPKSAYEVVGKIYKKAKSEKADDQLVKAAIYKLKLSAQFEDYDPAHFILELENELQSINSDATKKIVMSMLGELYQQYGMRNMGRFQNRTEDANGGKNEISLKSLAEIQTISYNYYLESIKDIPEYDISDFSVLTQTADDSRFIIKTETLEQLLFIRAIDHFGNSQSLLALPINNYSLNNISFFQTDNEFVNIEIPQKETEDFRLEAIRLYQKIAESNTFSGEQKLRFQFKRLEYLKANSDINNKGNLYATALENITELSGRMPSAQLAFIKLTEYYLQLAEGNRLQAQDQGIDAYKEVFRWIQKGKSKFPNGVYNDIVDRQRQRLNAQTLKVQTEQVVIPNQEFLANVSYRNTKTAFFKLVKVDRGQLEEYNQRRRQDDKLSYLLDLPMLKQWSIDLPQADDYKNHSIEVPMDGLKLGTYFLLASTNAEFNYNDRDIDLINQIHVSNISYTHQNRENNFEGYVLDRQNGQPIPGAVVEVFVSQYLPKERRSEWKMVKSLKSDTEGFFNFNGTQNNFSIKVSKGDDVLDLRISHYNYNNGNEREVNIVNIFTDRAIYRPGQLVYFKGIALKQSSKKRIPKILKGEKVTVKFKDTNWQDVSEQTIKANEFGTFNGTFVAPSEGLLGRHNIIVEIENGNGQKQIRIEEYKRPKFYAEFEKLQKGHVLGDEIEVQGKVISFSSVKMADAKVKYYVLKKQNYYPYFYSWRRPGTQRTEEIIDRGEVLTDSNGQFSLKFLTEASAKEYQNYIYEVKVDVTDLTGMSTSASKKIVIGQVPFYFKSNMPSNVFDSDIDKIKFEVNNNEGEAITADVKMTIINLQAPEVATKNKYWNTPDIMYLSNEEFVKRFPNETYGNAQNPEFWKELKMVKTEIYSLSNSPQPISLKGLQKGAYKVKFLVTDTKGNNKLYTEYINVTSRKGCAIPTDYIWYSNLNSKYQPGEELAIDLNVPYKKFNIFYRLSQGDRIIETGYIQKRNKGINYKIKEEDRGDLDLELMYVKHNRIHSKRMVINVPWDNKELKLKIDRFRDRLEPGSEENWTVQLKDNQGKNVTAEVLAGMYDSSLDQFVNHSWKSSFYPKYYAQMRYNGVGFGVHNSLTLKKYVNSGYQTFLAGYSPALNWFDFSLPYRGYAGGGVQEGRIMKRSGAPMASEAMELEESTVMDADVVVEDNAMNTKESETDNDEVALDKPIEVRENLNETVFFYPNLMTSEKGEAELSFKMNEALTKWKLLVFAHTKDLKYSFNEFEIETFKELIIEPNLPRFLRQGDNILLNAKVSNLGENPAEVQAQISMLAHTSKKDVTNLFLVEGGNSQSIKLKKGESKIVSWLVDVPNEFLDLVDIKMTVSNDIISDGELNQLPVLSNRMLVTESMVMHVGAMENEVFNFEALQKMDRSSTLENFRYTLEFYTKPSWLVLKSLPVMMDSESVVTTNIFDTYYATSLGFDLVSKDERIKDVVKKWLRDNEKGNLSKNQDLKLSDLKETPWVSESMAEDENIKLLSSFLDDNNVIQNLKSLSKKLKDRQLSNGGFSWTPGGKDNWYITQYILEGLARLNMLNVDVSTFDKPMLDEAVFYIDQELLRMHKRKGAARKLSPIVMHYLYVRPNYKNVPVSRQLRAVIDFYQEQIISDWPKWNSYQQGIMAYGLILDGKKEQGLAIANSLEERLVKDEKIGYYWNDQAGYYWYNADVEKQAFMIDLFKFLEFDHSLIDGLKLWLLKNKQTNSWKTSKATSSAVYAFLRDGDKLLTNNGNVKIRMPRLNQNVETSNAYTKNLIIKKQWQANDVTSDLAEVEVENTNNHIAWGASYWQYFEDLDKVESYTDNPMKLEKKLFKVVQSDKGDQLEELNVSTNLKAGDKLRVKIFLNVDRPMEFVQMKDMRGSGLEPTNVLSQYKWQDGLGYYESTKDVATYFYFDYLPKGNFVFEYETYVVHSGTYSNGNCTIQSMYAPEFGSHSAGQVLSVK